MEAYNKKLVKKIIRDRISTNGSTASESYVYLEGITSQKATQRQPSSLTSRALPGIRKITKTVGEGFKLFEKNSGELDEYKVGFTVKRH
jgi:type III restriction enzyme